MARPRFPMGGMGANANNMIKQAQKMQQEMLKAQEEMENSDFEATSGGGAVLVKMNDFGETQYIGPVSRKTIKTLMFQNLTNLLVRIVRTNYWSYKHIVI